MPKELKRTQTNNTQEDSKRQRNLVGEEKNLVGEEKNLVGEEKNLVGEERRKRNLVGKERKDAHHKLWLKVLGLNNNFAGNVNASFDEFMTIYKNSGLPVTHSELILYNCGGNTDGSTMIFILRTFYQLADAILSSDLFPDKHKSFIIGNPKGKNKNFRVPYIALLMIPIPYKIRRGESIVETINIINVLVKHNRLELNRIYPSLGGNTPFLHLIHLMQTNGEMMASAEVQSIFALFIESGASLTQKNTNGVTPLISIIIGVNQDNYLGTIELAKVLIEKRSDVHEALGVRYDLSDPSTKKLYDWIISFQTKLELEMARDNHSPKSIVIEAIFRHPTLFHNVLTMLA